MNDEIVANLHIHTNRSDGHDTPEELLYKGKEAGLIAMMQWDHDKGPIQDKTLEERAEALGIVLIKGIEINAKEMHVGILLPHMTEETEKEIQEYETKATEERRKQYQRACRKEGIDITALDPENPQRADLINFMLEQRMYLSWAQANAAAGRQAKRFPRKMASVEEAISLAKRLEAPSALLHPLKNFKNIAYFIEEADFIEMDYSYFEHDFSEQEYEKDPLACIRKSIEKIESIADHYNLYLLEYRKKKSIEQNIPRNNYERCAREINQLCKRLTVMIAESLRRPAEPIGYCGGSDYHGENRPGVGIKSAGLTLEEYKDFIKAIVRFNEQQTNWRIYNPEVHAFIEANKGLL